MAQKKILIDLERLRYPHSGLANVCRNLAKGIENQNQNSEIQYFAPKNEVKNFLADEKIIPYQKWHKFYENFSKKFDLIHITHQSSHFFTKNYKNTKKIITLHDLNFLHENLPERKKQKILKKVQKNLKFADYVVCISEFVRQDFLKNQHLFELKNLKEILVIHNGISFPETKNYDLGRFSDFKNKKYILNIGVLFEKKNQLPLVEMLPYLETDLVLVASGEKEPYATKIRQRIKELGLENRVHFLKNISEEEKYALIQNCEAMCHPSLAEGFGIPPIEAMIFGKAVFLSKFTSLPEIGGEMAFYFEDFSPETMANFYREKKNFYHENSEILSEKIKNWASQFDYKTMAKNYLELYKNCLKNY